MNSIKAIFVSLLLALSSCHGGFVPKADSGPDADADADADGDADADADVDNDNDDVECECSQGPCCDGCHFLGVETRCDEQPVLTNERQCASDDCGADILRRNLFRHCSGVSAECPEDVLRLGDWEVFEECSDDQVCVFSSGTALCHSCIEGCEEGHCNEPQCDAGPCCDVNHFAPSTTRCDETPESEECQCTSLACGADLECRSQHRFCTGLSAECTDEHLEWEDWSLSEDCTPDQVCEVSGESGDCVDCDFRCELGVCREQECSGGACCDDGVFRPSSFVCSSEIEYRCAGAGCGDDTQEREVTQSCSGTSDDCDGAITNGSWTTFGTCTPNQVCQSSDFEASCLDCEEGCEGGECVTCSMASDGACPSICEVTSDVDCCEEATCNATPDGCCPSSCLEDDGDCAPTWVRRTPAMSPPERSYHGMAYDSARGVTVLFGGRDGTGSFQDTWEWDGTEWAEQTSTTSPLGRASFGMAYDSARGVTVLFGGRDSDSAYLSDTWEWDGTEWVERTPGTSPLERASFGMAYDSARGFTVLFGGENSSGYFDDTWEWDGTEWVERNPAARAPERLAYSMVYDSARGATVLFGGQSSDYDYLGDTWEWDGTVWVERTPAASPSVRVLHPISYDSVRGVTILFGGWGSSGSLGDTWEWDGTEWIERTPATSPSGRRSHSMAFDSARGFTVLFGAGTDTWEYGLE